MVGSDVYRGMLKEMGADHKSMDYLFDDDSDEDDEDIDLTRDDDSLEGSNGVENYLKGIKSVLGHGHSEGVSFHNNNDDNNNSRASDNDNSSSNNNNMIATDNNPYAMLRWESSELEDSLPGGTAKPLAGDHAEDDAEDENHGEAHAENERRAHPFAWQRMLEMANAEHEELMEKVVRLRRAQEETSPGKPVGKGQHVGKPRLAPGKENDSFGLAGLGSRAGPNAGGLPASPGGQELLEQLSTRDARLKDEWKSQQEESDRIKDQLASMQNRLRTKQEEWEHERRELFSPPRGGPEKAFFASPGSGSTLVPTPPLGAAPWTGGGGNDNGSDSSNDKNNDNAAPGNEHDLSSALAAISRLEARLEESRSVQESQKEELFECKNKLRQREVDHQALLLRHETEQKARRDAEADHERELKAAEKDLEDALDKLQKQIATNQDLRDQHRERCERLGSKADALAAELSEAKAAHQKLLAEAARAGDLAAEQEGIRSELALRAEEQALRAERAEAKIGELEAGQASEIDRWRSEAEDRRRELELNTTQMTAELDEANALYSEWKETNRDRHTRELESRLEELRNEHAREVNDWKARVDDQQRRMEAGAAQASAALEEARSRYSELERKHDREVKEWQQLLLDSGFDKAAADEAAGSNESDNNSSSKEDERKRMIGAVGRDRDASSELLSPIRMAAPAAHHAFGGGPGPGDFSLEYDHSSILNKSSDDQSAESLPSQSISNKIDDLLEEIGEMDLERTMILKEINDGVSDDGSDEGSLLSAQHDAAGLDTTREPEPAAENEAVDNGAEEGAGDENEKVDENEPPATPHRSMVESEGQTRDALNESNSTTDSEVLDQTLHLLNNLKVMLTSPEKEHEVSVLERLEVLSELMQSNDGAELERLEGMSELMKSQDLQESGVFEPSRLQDPESADRASASGRTTPGNRSGAFAPSSPVESPQPVHSPSPRGAASSASANTSWISAVRSTAAEDPWPALVAELRSRCEFLERDRDEVTRITAQILESERTSHRAELEAAMATAERKANEALHDLHLEKNRELGAVYRSVCPQCQQEVYSMM